MLKPKTRQVGFVVIEATPVWTQVSQPVQDLKQQ